MRMIRYITLTLLLVLTMPYQALAVKIVIDAGHGGSDPGAIGVNGLREKDANLDIAYKLYEELIEKGYDVALSRTEDQYISLQDRVEFTSSAKADLFVSIHANYYHNPSTRGSMVLYYDNQLPQASYPASSAMKRLSGESKSFAQHVLDSIVSAAGTVNTGLLPSAAYVIRMGQVPSILVETAFLSNDKDSELLQNDSVRRKMAVGIANGIEAYKPIRNLVPAPPKPTPAPPGQVLFYDSLDHWAREAVLKLYDMGLVEGIDNRYEPERSITRAEFLTMLDRLFPFPDTNFISGQSETELIGTFADISDVHWASSTIARALALGYIQGYQDQTVRPDQPLTRGEAAAIFDRILVPNSSSTTDSTDGTNFSDVPEWLWSAKAINYLGQLGFINGVTEDRYMPERLMKRAEMAVMLDRFVTTQM